MEGSTFIGNLFLVYVIAQLISTAYGLTIMYALDPIVEQKLKDRGYEERNRNSLYKFNDKLKAIALGFVPMYYAIKSTEYIRGKEPLNRLADEKIVSGDYITADEQKKIFEQTELEKNDESLFVPRARIEFEKPEPYRARAVDNSLYDTYETPIEYVTREMDEDEALKITPFVDMDHIVEKEVERDVTSKDVAKFISELSPSELAELREKINLLIDINRKENFQLSLNKDVA